MENATALNISIIVVNIIGTGPAPVANTSITVANTTIDMASKEGRQLSADAEEARLNPFCMQGTRTVWKNTTSTYICESCAVGTYSLGGAAAKCVPCQPGESSMEGSPMCTTCPAGTFSSGGGPCQKCAAGIAAIAGQPRCMRCPTGYVSEAGATFARRVQPAGSRTGRLNALLASPASSRSEGPRHAWRADRGHSRSVEVRDALHAH